MDYFNDDVDSNADGCNEKDDAAADENDGTGNYYNE